MTSSVEIIEACATLFVTLFCFTDNSAQNRHSCYKYSTH